jgi:NAD(P)-dependent dehydrogenase (short-subunit alcohol dehydrogenase family)
VVTGGAGALGAAIAVKMLDQGAAVTIPVRGEPSPAALPGSLRARAGEIFLHRADLTVEADVEAFAAAVEKNFGGIDFCVNAAGGFAGGSRLEETPPAELRAMIDTNLVTVFLMCRAALRSMRKKGQGRIVTVAAMPALFPRAGLAAYAAAKRAVATLTEVIAEEVKGTGITANAVAPGVIHTEANLRAMPRADTSKWVAPAEIAGLVAYLCSDEARSVNGNVIRIAGGL